MKTIALSNQKGGVGKTSTVVNLALFLRDKREARVLVVDLDAQRNTSSTLQECATGVTASNLFEQQASLDALSGEAGKIDLIEGDSALTDLDRHASPDKVITAFVANLGSLKERYDYCIVDTPPALGLRMTAALIAATHVVTPIEPEQFAIDGLGKMITTIKNVKQKYNKGLSFVGILINKLDRRSPDQKETLQALQDGYPGFLIPEVIGWKSAIPRALSNRVPLWDVKSTAARGAVKELLPALEYIVQEADKGAN